MNAAEREALSRIQKLVDDGDIYLTPHFLERLEQRGLFLYDAFAAIEEASSVRSDGFDPDGSERWFVVGPTLAQADVEILIVIDRLAKFVTIYWI